MPELTDAKIISELRKFDSATICNVVATYGGTDLCLSLYDPWRGEYYTDSSLHCIYPELGPVCGYAATAWYSEKSAKHKEVNRWVLAEHLDSTPKPIVLVAKQTYPPALRNRSGLFGGVMTAQFKALGVAGIITDGAMRDLEEVREEKMQYLAAGLTPGHGPLQLRAAGIPLKVAGMKIAPGEVIHMDQCGAVKFPAKYLPQVLEYATRLLDKELSDKAIFEDPEFTLEKWKVKAKGSPNTMI